MVRSYFEIFIGFFDHFGGQSCFDLVRGKGIQFFAMGDINDVTNTTEFIGWILNGNVSDLFIKFESIVDYLKTNGQEWNDDFIR